MIAGSRLLALLLTSCAIVAGCRDSNDGRADGEAAETPQAQLEPARQRWQALGLDRYVVEERVTFGAGEIAPTFVTVELGQVSGTAFDDPAIEPYENLLLSMEATFAYIEEALNLGRPVTAVYDIVTGMPLAVFDPGLVGAVDDEVTWSFRLFQPAQPLPPAEPVPAQPSCETANASASGVPSGVLPVVSGDVVVPDVAGRHLADVICRLALARLLLEIPDPRKLFVVWPGTGGLESILVASIEPAPGARVAAGSTVAATRLDLPEASTGVPFPDAYPERIPVPDVVGLPYSLAVRRLRPGLLPVVDLKTLPPLSAEASALGLDAYEVVGQSPAPGTKLRFEPNASTVQLQLALRTAP